MKCMIVALAAGTAALCGEASACAVSTFTSTHGETYIEAEVALIDDADPARALELTGMLWASDLNCFERTSVRKLRAATLVELEDYGRAAELLEPLAEDTAQPDAERAQTAYNVGQLYLAIGEAEKGQRFLDLSDALGGYEPG